MLSDFYFLGMSGVMWWYTTYLWSIKETELNVEKIVIDITMVGCGLVACVFTAITTNIFFKKVEDL
jgi:hypothetical protein